MNSQGNGFELEFRLTEGYYLCEASKVVDGEIQIEYLLPRSNGQVIEYLRGRVTHPHQAVDTLARLPEVREIELIEKESDWARLELITRGKLVRTLADSRALVTNIEARAGQARITTTVPPHENVANAVEEFLAEFPDAELTRRKQTEVTTPTRTRDQVVSDLLSELTDRQLQVLLEAYRSGYFEVPRTNEGQEIARDLGITSATFSEHLRRAQKTVFERIFE